MRSTMLWASLIVLAIASSIFAVSFGAANISLLDVLLALKCQFSGDCQLGNISQRIIIDLRLPRVILAFLAGSGLAISGAVLQTVTRNPLADPYLFGISSGASFGAVLVIAAVGAASGLSLTLGAFAGGAAAVLLVIAMAGSGVQIERMLLAGVATSFMFSAATNLVLYSSDPEAAASWLFWSLGSFTRAQWDGLWLPVVVIVLGMAVFLVFSRQLQTLLAGDESARSMGVEAGKVRIAMLLLSSLITATLVAYCGGIGFVGLMIPHIVRRLVHANTSTTLLLTALMGGVFMIWIDVLARQLIENRELPIGVITAAVGSGFFLLVLRKPRWRDD